MTVGKLPDAVAEEGSGRFYQSRSTAQPYVASLSRRLRRGRLTPRHGWKPVCPEDYSAGSCHPRVGLRQEPPILLRLTGEFQYEATERQAEAVPEECMYVVLSLPPPRPILTGTALTLDPTSAQP